MAKFSSEVPGRFYAALKGERGWLGMINFSPTGKSYWTFGSKMFEAIDCAQYLGLHPELPLCVSSSSFLKLAYYP